MREQHRAVAGVLRDLLPALFALLVQLLEVRDDRAEQLQDDRGGDVRHDPQGEDRRLGEGPAHEQVVQAEERARRPAAANARGQGGHVDARRGQVLAQPVDPRAAPS